MSKTDPIADMLTRIRNAVAVGKNEVFVPHSNSKEKIARVLVSSSFLAGVHTVTTDRGASLELRIAEQGRPSPITEITRLSRPGRRMYAGYDDIPVVKRGRGIVVISTPAGIMTGQQAKSKNLGGELICKVY